jgi:hypothetical protein
MREMRKPEPGDPEEDEEGGHGHDVEEEEGA